MGKNSNPLLNFDERNEYFYYQFDKISKDDFLPAIEKSIVKAERAIKKIKENKKEPDFHNTIEALESASEDLNRTATCYFNLLNAESDNSYKELAQKISPLLSKFKNSIILDDQLFEKIRTVYENQGKMKLSDEQKRLLETHFLQFKRNGALLDQEKKEELRKIDDELSSLGPKFSQNLLNSTNAFALFINEKDKLEGLPEHAVEQAASLARLKGKEGAYCFNLQMPSMMPVIQYAKNRDLRRKIVVSNAQRAIEGEFSNIDILKKIARLRHKRANLLGYATHAHYVLEERMAKTPDTVLNFLERLYEASMKKAKTEKTELEAFARETDGLEGLMNWDWRYYGEKLKEKKYHYNSEELRPYFKAENVIQGVFLIAEKLYKIKFNETFDISSYHKDVKVFKVFDEKNQFQGILYVDLHPRETKSAGAWMTTYLEQGYYKGKISRPHVSIVANLTPSTEERPSLLTLDEVETIFHEFGHALHALLSKCTYQSLGGANVYWDFVELPSQIMENWVYEKEALSLFAHHYQTGELIPDQMIDKIRSSKKFLSAIYSLRQLTFGFLDMAWHNQEINDNVDVLEFEDKATDKLQVFPKIPETAVSPSFAHIFHGGYSSGYYSYKWAEVLEADAFELFREKGVFNEETAQSFRENILSRGNSADPMELYVKFRGRKPDPDALLKKDGLI